MSADQARRPGIGSPRRPGLFHESSIAILTVHDAGKRVKYVELCFTKRGRVPKLMLSSLGKLVRDQRGAKRMREVAHEIGISPPTLMRIENGRTPDVETFGKVCRWLGIDPGDFLGFESTAEDGSSSEPPVRVSAHFRVERLPRPETANALARMLLFIAAREKKSEISENGGADA